jgi:hypothetical protein
MRQEVAWIVVMVLAAGCSSSEERREALRQERASLERTQEEFRSVVNTPAGMRYHDGWERDSDRERMLQAFRKGEQRVREIYQELETLEQDGTGFEASFSSTRSASNSKGTGPTGRRQGR